MAVVRPFRALRYSDSFSDLTSLLAPPYDIIGAREQRALYERDAHNVIRLEYGITTPEDSPENSRYTRAKATQDEWLAQGALTVEETPCLYPHRQRFSWAGTDYARFGFFAAVKLQPFDEGDILPHEWTLKGPKVDRLELMRTCLTSFSPVFGLFDGKDTGIDEAMRRATESAPLAAADGFGFNEQLWRMTNSGVNGAISDALANRKILIADGHHRYETMLALRDILREKYPDAAENAAFNYAFMLLVDVSDPGLIILPTQRLMLLTPEMQAEFGRIAGETFHLEEISVPNADAIPALLAKHANEHAFVWYAAGKYTLLTTPKQQRNGLPVLDVQALQEWIISPLLALDPAKAASVESNVRYAVKPADAVARVDNGDAQGALLLNPTPIEEVFLLAKHGVRLPQKSTYFYPKVPTGLVMHHLRGDICVG